MFDKYLKDCKCYYTGLQFVGMDTERFSCDLQALVSFKAVFVSEWWD